jgi:hypothetical protein
VPRISYLNTSLRIVVSSRYNKNFIFHLGVCSLSFSTSGKMLLSVGVDATIAVWRWEEGMYALFI